MKRNVEKFKKFWCAISNTFYEYTDLTKVNGMYYLRRNTTNQTVRFLWSLIPTSLITLAALLVFFLWRRYLDSPTRMITAVPLSAVQVPFPGVTICHPQSSMEYKTAEFINKIKLSSNTTKSQIMDAMPSLGILTEHQWTLPNINDLKLIDELLNLNNVSIVSAVMELGMTCEDFIIKCRWAGKEFPCFQSHEYLTWMTSTSHLGACCSFNYHPNTEEYIPFSTNTFGMNGGLSIIGTGYPQTADGKSGVLFSAGFVLLVHHPNDFAVESAPTTLLQTGAETFITVYPTDASCSNQVLDLPEPQRNCINPNDYDDIDSYRQPACTLKCMRDAVHKLCKCHPYHLPELMVDGQKKLIKICSALDAMCFVDNYLAFKTLNCNCLPSCSDITYKTSTFTIDFLGRNYSINPIYHTNLTKDEFVAHVYLANQRIAANKRIVVMSWISLLCIINYEPFNNCLIVIYFSSKFRWSLQLMLGN